MLLLQLVQFVLELLPRFWSKPFYRKRVAVEHAYGVDYAGGVVAPGGASTFTTFEHFDLLRDS